MRTPEERFADLPGFPWRPRYHEWNGLRVHRVDEGPRDAPVALCLHGEPTWSYLYRKMIPGLRAAGYRVVAPDFIGFGRSDKPEDEALYTFDFHRGMLLDLLERMDLRRVLLIVQDWGGLLGLTLPMEMPARFERLLVMNTTLGTGDEPLPTGFLQWRDWVRRNPDLDCAKLMGRACRQLPATEAAAYEAPYPDARHKAGARRFPELVPDRPDAPGAAISRQARDWWTKTWTGESFMAIGMKDPVLGPAVMQALHRRIRDCPPPYRHAEGGHFLQEWGEEVLAAALAHWRLA